VPLVEWSWWGTPAERRARFLRAHLALEEFADPQVLGASVVSGALVAAGRRHAVALLGAQPWEQAAIGLLLRESGARVTSIGGGGWDIFSPSLLSAAPVIHKLLVKRLRSQGPWRGPPPASITRLFE
jgi:fructose-1,6-bisphosphatase/inositol monophosphatase family enzyme